MASPKQVVYSPVDISDGDYVDFETDPKAEAENAEFEKFKSEMHDSQDDAKITVGKKLTDSRGRPMGRQIFECFECGIDDYTFSQLCTRIREDFGTGLYTVIGRNSKGAYKFRKTVGILAPNTPDNAPAGQDIGALIDKFSDAMQRQQMQTEEMFSKLVGPRTGGDAIDQISKLAVAIGPILKVMGIGQPPVPPKSLMEQLTEFKMIKELFGGDSDDSGGEANLYSLLGETVKAFGGPIAAAIAAGAKSGDLDAHGMVANPQKALPNPGKPVNENLQKHNEAMKSQIRILIANAKSGISPEQFGEIVVNNTPEDKADALFDFISSDDYFVKVVELVPEAKAHEKWFVALRERIIDLMTEDDDGGGETESTGLSEDSEISVPTEITEGTVTAVRSDLSERSV